MTGAILYHVRSSRQSSQEYTDIGRCQHHSWRGSYKNIALDNPLQTCPPHNLFTQHHVTMHLLP